MAKTSFEEDVSYFVWPHVNYFPVTDDQDENDFCRRLESGTLRIVIPVVSLLGIVGNVTNMSILIKGKLNKSSTWLILALAAADTTFLMGVNNVPSQLYARGRKIGFEYPELEAKVLYYVYFLQKCLELVGKVSSMFLPCLITFDRLVAVLLPFRYQRIMTVNRIRWAISFVYLISFLCYIVYCLKFTFKYLPESQINITSPQMQHNLEANNTVYVGILTKSSFYLANNQLYTTVVKITAFLYGPVNLFLTVTGCVIVGVWIKVYTNNRKTFLANKAPTGTTCFKNVFSFRKTSTHTSRSTDQTHSSSGDNRRDQISPTTDTAAIMIPDPHTYQNRVTSVSNEKTNRCSLDMDVFVTNIQPKTYCKTSTGIKNEDKTKCSETDQRSRVVNKRQGRTTRTLLSVCLVYSVANSINFFVLFYCNSSNVSSSNQAIVLEISYKFIMVLNSACNFLFYVGPNRYLQERYRKCIAMCNHKVPSSH